jgi:hypothetical protein
MLGTLDDLMNGRIDLLGTIAPVAGNALDAQRLVMSHNCQSAATMQFFSSLVANANDTPTLVEAGIQFPGAAAEADPALNPALASDLFDACMRVGGYLEENARYCTCVDDEMPSILDGAALAEALSDFESVAAAWFHGGERASTQPVRVFQQCVARTAR